MQDLFKFLTEHNIPYQGNSDDGLSPEQLLFSRFCLDSRLADKHSIFVVTENNSAFIAQAIEQGCVALLIDKQSHQLHESVPIPVINITNLADQLGYLLQAFFQILTLNYALIGITGTNGKTSTAHLVAQLLTQANYTVGILGTLGNGLFHRHKSLSLSPLTTLDTLSLYQKLAEFNQQQVDFVVMEVSSHGIEQNRIMGLVFDVVCFTNLSPEHLDYHPDMEAYFHCKARLFKEYVNENTQYVINTQEAYGQRLQQILQQDHIPPFSILSYQYIDNDQDFKEAHKKAHLQLHQYHQQPILHYQNHSYQLSMSALNSLEAENRLCAFAILIALEFPIIDILYYAQSLTPVSGRMQIISSEKDDIEVIIDYAHTSDALYRVLNQVKQNNPDKARIYCVFGCGGNRDTSKRQAMAEVASHYSEFVIITDDNPRDEDPRAIRQQIISGIDMTKTQYREIPDRAMAIKQAISQAQPSDTVLIAGKGHEKYQLIQGKKIPFDDVEIAQKALQVRRKHPLSS